MKIEDNRTDENVLFVNLSVGDCFIFNDEYHIKIDIALSKRNAFNLERNEIVECFKDTVVTLVRAKVVVE